MGSTLKPKGASGGALSESPRDLLRNLLPADWDAKNWPLDPQHTRLVIGSFLYFWLGAGTVNQRRDVATKMGTWDHARAEVHRHRQLGGQAVYLEAFREPEKRREAQATFGSALLDGLRLRRGWPLVRPMLGQLEAQLVPEGERHPLDSASEDWLAYLVMCALWRDVSGAAPLPAGLSVCKSCTLVFEPVLKKVTPGRGPAYCPRCGEHREREEAKRALVPRLAKGASVTIRGPVGTEQTRRRAELLGMQPNWDRSMVVSRCLECGEYFPGAQPASCCSPAHYARWRRRRPA